MVNEPLKFLLFFFSMRSIHILYAANSAEKINSIVLSGIREFKISGVEFLIGGMFWILRLAIWICMALSNNRMNSPEMNNVDPK